ncbi:polysaccharide lyase [Paraglaciecola sp. L3A3]|uniref:polysaccharide lyase n=1 Tax=Paraglaciecola sp. L3A3 TaxID=2686358 RepID=UPI00131CDC18|nr:hypothetical protein [Paraglaciecola sp. L3A3]
MYLIQLVSFLMIVSFNLYATPLFKVNFDSSPLGLYQGQIVKHDWSGLKWQKLAGRAEIVRSNDYQHKNVLKVSYPKGSVGPEEGGSQFVVPLKPVKELWLSYQLKFSNDFDFRLGGKLPGLSSGGGKFTGGNIPTKGEGWSARYMWRENGEAVIYLYYMDMPGKWGEDLSLRDSHFETDKWYTLTQYIKVNDLGKSNGNLQVWINDKQLLNKNDIQFRGQDNALIDSFYFSTFHGGNTARWGPKNRSVAYFDNFIISSEPIQIK